MPPGRAERLCGGVAVTTHCLITYTNEKIYCLFDKIFYQQLYQLLI